MRRVINSNALMAALFLWCAGTVSLSMQDVSTQQWLDGLRNAGRWTTYSGDYNGQRHSPLTQITPANVNRLTVQWLFQTGAPGKFEATPLVVDGIMYLTGPDNHAWALDARTGRQIWHYKRALPDQLNICCGRVNRGLAILGNRLYMATLDAP